MKVKIQLMDDNGEVLDEHLCDASQPSQWRARPGQKLTSPMPAQSDAQNTGTYELFGFTYQPHLRVDRPNGYTSPVPEKRPLTGLPMNFPSNTANRPSWGTDSPTSAPQIKGQEPKLTRL